MRGGGTVREGGEGGREGERNEERNREKKEEREEGRGGEEGEEREGDGVVSYPALDHGGAVEAFQRVWCICVIEPAQE